MNIASTQYSLSTKSLEIYFSGCLDHCEGCHNSELWNFDIGENYLSQIPKIKDKIIFFNKLIDKIFFLGGEPLDQNKTEFTDFVKQILEINKPLWLFTRHELQYIDKDILQYFDYIKCGKYIVEKTCDNNIQYDIKLATSNQNIYMKEKDY
jgi:anaerobic ribonucleoside-triphosphate reductase activating protein